MSVPAAPLTLAALTGCISSPAAPTAPPATAPQETAGPPLVTPLTPAAGPGLAKPGQACARFAAAAATIVTPGDTLRQSPQSRQAAARSYGTPRLQAVYDGAGQGGDPQHELWQQHRARVLVHTDPADADLHHDHNHDHDPDRDHDGSAGAEHQIPAAVGAQHAAVIVTGTAHGHDGWTAPIVSYRLECLLLADPVPGWLVEDLVTDLLPKPGTLAPTSSR